MLRKSNGIIFGATGFIGTQVTHEMTKQGAKLILHGTSKKKLEKLDDDLKKNFNLRQILLQGDFSEKAFFSNLSNMIQSRFKCLDFLMNFVGRFDRLSPLTNFSNNEWEKMMEINVSSYWRIIKELEPLLKKSSKPRVMFLIDEDSSKGKPYQNFLSISQAMKKVIGRIFYEENKRLKIITKIIQIPCLNNGISLKIAKNQRIEKKFDKLAEAIVEKTFDDKNNELIVSLF